jgi:hypothetical protein
MTWYGTSNGNGPLHLLPAGQDSNQTLCGKIRFTTLSTTYHDLDPGRGVCTACRRVLRASERPTAAKIAEVAVAVKELAAARQRAAALIKQLRGGPNDLIGPVLVAANRSGFSQTELAVLFGCSREAIRQRIDRVTS